MTDRELLELAAKAAGIRGGWSPDRDGVGTIRVGVWDYWNPLADSGQALELAVKLRLMDEVSVMNAQYESEDPYAATRRAIVRAAAEIGRSMT